jgi:uncharacterized protein (TIGR02246 family)
MKPNIVTSAIFAACLAAPAYAAEPAPLALVGDFVQRWNAHDAAALGAMFAEDGDFIGITGTLWKDPAEIVQVHRQLFAGRYDKSEYQADGAPTASVLGPDIVLLRWHWTISKVRDEQNQELPPYRGIFSWVLVRRGPEWKIRAAQNELTK